MESEEEFYVPNSPERGLWAAVLYRALRDVLGSKLRHSEKIGKVWGVNRRDAEKWLRGADFEVAGARWVCIVVGVPWRLVEELLNGGDTGVEIERRIGRVFRSVKGSV